MSYPKFLRKNLAGFGESLMSILCVPYTALVLKFTVVHDVVIHCEVFNTMVRARCTKDIYIYISLSALRVEFTRGSFLL